MEGKVIGMKKRKKRLLSVLVLAFVAVVIIIAGLYFYPVWKSAKVLEEKLDFLDCSYELEVELDKDQMEDGQNRVLEILAELTGYEQQAMYSPVIRGSVWEDKIHALICPKDAAEPIIELYLSDDMVLINEAMLYNVIRRNLLGESTVLSFLVPVQEGSMYMSLEQVEELFGIDLSSVREFRLPFDDNGLTAAKYFAGLSVMKHTRDESGESFAAETEQAKLQLGLSGEGEAAVITVQFSVEEPAKVLEENTRLFTILGMELPDERFRILKRISVDTVSGEGQGLEMPVEFVSQEVLDIISGIRKWITNNF